MTLGLDTPTPNTPPLPEPSTAMTDGAQAGQPLAQTAETDESVVVTDEVAAQVLVQDNPVIMHSFLVNYGILDPTSSTDQDIFNLLYQFIQDLKKDMNELKAQLGQLSSEFAQQIFSIAQDGIKKMLQHAANAKRKTFISVGVGLVGQGLSAGITLGAMGGYYKGSTTPRVGAYGNTQILHARTGFGSALSEITKSGGSFFSAEATYEQAEGQADQKRAEAEQAFLNSLVEALNQLMRSAESVYSGSGQIHSGTLSAEASFKTQA